MKAAQFATYGDPSVLNVVDIDKPVVADGKVLVEVHAASLNPFDSKIRAGYMKDFIPIALPATTGGDIAGVVTDVGEGVTNVAVGDKVYGSANTAGGDSGALAEFALTKAGEVAKLPESIDFEAGAAIVLVGVSAWQAVTQHLNVQAGQKLFINGAGGIGAIAIMIAKYIGAYVATTASGEGIEEAKKLGADEVIDYKSEDFTTKLSDYDAVFDTVGDAEIFAKTLTILKKGGTAVSMGMVDPAAGEALDVTAMGQQTHVTTEALDALTRLIEDGVVVPQVGKVFALDQVVEAFIARESGAVRGKVVISIAG